MIKKFKYIINEMTRKLPYDDRIKSFAIKKVCKVNVLLIDK